MAKSLINQPKWQMFLTITLSTLPPKLMTESPEQENLLSITWEENLNLLLFFVSPTDTTEVECIIAEFKNGKALGPCGIPCNLLTVPASGKLTVLVRPFNGTHWAARASTGYRGQENFCSLGKLLTFVGVINF